MTIEEKRTAIANYCHSKPLCTSDQGYPCPLYGYVEECFECDDEAIERNYALVSDMPDYHGPIELKATEPQEDIINRPAHYNREGAMESIDEMVLIFGKEVVKNFCLCNVWKYRYRSADKNGIEDIKKSDWYMRKYKELCENG